MIEKEWLGLLSVALGAIGYGNYIISVLRKRTRPHFFSWAVWALLMGIVFTAQIRDGAGAGSWLTGFSDIACVAIAVLALVYYGERNITRGDWIAFIAALSIIPVWVLTKDPLWAVMLATAIDAMAYYPTYRKSWLRPHEENLFSFSMDMLKWAPAVLAIERYSAVTLTYPLFLLIANATLVCVIFFRRAALARATE